MMMMTNKKRRNINIWTSRGARLKRLWGGNNKKSRGRTQPSSKWRGNICSKRVKLHRIIWGVFDLWFWAISRSCWLSMVMVMVMALVVIVVMVLVMMVRVMVMTHGINSCMTWLWENQGGTISESKWPCSKHCTWLIAHNASINLFSLRNMISIFKWRNLN